MPPVLSGTPLDGKVSHIAFVKPAEETEGAFSNFRSLGLSRFVAIPIHRCSTLGTLDFWTRVPDEDMTGILPRRALAGSVYHFQALLIIKHQQDVHIRYSEQLIG